jgi:hypothetical protein
MHERHAMLFAEIHDQVLVGIAHNGEQVVEPFGGHCGSDSFEYFHFLPLPHGGARAGVVPQDSFEESLTVEQAWQQPAVADGS